MCNIGNFRMVENAWKSLEKESISQCEKILLSVQGATRHENNSNKVRTIIVENIWNNVTKTTIKVTKKTDLNNTIECNNCND